MMKISVLVVIISLIYKHIVASSSSSSWCDYDSECYYNGVCESNACVCDPGWTGNNCSELILGKVQNTGAYGYSPNISSWGGDVIIVDDVYHMYVSEIIDGCGLCTWQTNSRIVHATSNSLSGPYIFRDVVLGVESSNPKIIVVDGIYLLFHIGSGSGGSSKHCSNAGRMDINDDDVNKMTIPYDSQGILSSSSPNGPWKPESPSGYGTCNNPAPFLMPNNSMIVICKAKPQWYAYLSTNSWKGPWTKEEVSFDGPYVSDYTWEDPFVWLDQKTQIWKMITHAIHHPSKPERVSGFAFSSDALNWTQSPVQPYGNQVETTTGQKLTFPNRERPFIFFDNEGNMVALFNGVTGHPYGDKEHCGVDWTYTLSQPILLSN
eukprot:TRINITY_DN341_c2_g1_i1.p1 TRINITY_DN341_c2_g1~~TRINITY_DN341_c2_g1_i1.p1  ORF type:complete len:377 (+),score=75.90 TRINITY_DN341_c2_g1_i1:240-1370(+)